MTRADPPMHLRLFLSAPGDVGAERAAVAAIVDGLQYDPLLRGLVTFELVAWDRPGTPILASETPQASIDAGLPRPSECDIVVTVFWKRLGQPLPYPEYQRADGTPYQSGTEWEFDDAVRAARGSGRPKVLLYRSRVAAMVDLDAGDVEEQFRQKRALDGFFGRIEGAPDAPIRHGYTWYGSLDEFRTKVERDLRAVTRQLLDAGTAGAGRRDRPGGPARAPGSTPESAPLWRGSPFPGLRPFTTHDAPIYFGRTRETDELVSLMTGNRFVAVVGASGSGKSSLVGAGLLSRLAAGSTPDGRDWLLPCYREPSRQWEGLRCTPGELGPDPFLAFAAKLAPLVGAATLPLAQELAAEPDAATRYLGRLAADADRRDVLVVLDQFEELFTVADDRHLVPFVRLLAALAEPPGRVVVTMRADYYHRCLDLPELTRLLERAQFPLSAPDNTLIEMITRPAERAGLLLEEGLPGLIAHDTGREPGALPLLAYTLDELYRAGAAAGRLTLAAYRELGGVHGAVGIRADLVFARLGQPWSVVSPAFRHLVEVDDQGRAARRRAPLSIVAADPPARRLVEMFTEARLLVQDRGRGHEPTVYVAHEALFGNWARLRDWIETFREDLRMLRQVRAAAEEWARHSRRDAYLWQHERLVPVYEMVERLRPDLDPVTRDFIRPEYERLIPALRDPDVEEHRRQSTADRLVEIGEAVIPGLLDALGDESPAVRGAASGALVRLGAAAVPGLLEFLYDPFPEVRLAAIAALRRIGDRRAIPRLGAALRDTDARVRSMAAGALEVLGGEEAVIALAESVDDSDVNVRWRAAGLLGAFGPGAVGLLLGPLADEDPTVRANARAAILAIGDDGLDPLLAEAFSGDPAASAVAMDAVAMLAAQSGRAVERLVGVLGSDDPGLRWRAAEALARARDAAALPAILTALGDRDPAVRQAAARAAGAIGAPDAVQALVATFTDPDPDVRWSAAWALRSIGAPAVTALAAVLRTDQRGDRVVLAGQTLGQLGEPAVQVLLEAVRAREDWRRLVAADALAACGPAAVAGLVALLQTDDRTVHRVAVDTLTAIGPAAIPALTNAARAPDPAVRSGVAEALAGLARSETRLVLASLLVDKDPATRSAAGRALAAIGASGLTVLLRAAGHPEAEVRQTVRDALVAAGPPAVPGLLDLAAGDDEPTRSAAVDMLTAIGTPSALFGLARLDPTILSPAAGS